MFSTDERILLICAVGWLATFTVLALLNHRRGCRLLEFVRENVAPELWDALGQPRTMRAAVADPQRRWYRFVNGGTYRERCRPEIVAAIDQFRSQVKFMLISLLATGVPLVVYFWPLLAPEFLN